MDHQAAADAPHSTQFSGKASTPSRILLKL
jgi:hypothetical protein